MTRKLFLYGLLSLISPSGPGLVAAADEAAACFGYTSEIANYIPGCAGVCFLSFLNVNYEADDNGRMPTLNQLCAQTGKTGYTVGEGALQCITAEKEVGSCSDVDASESVVEAAYRICSGRRNAVQPTHTAITATMILPPTAGGAISIPSPKTTGSDGEPIQTTLVTDTTAPPVKHSRTSSSSHSSTSKASSSSTTSGTKTSSTATSTTSNAAAATTTASSGAPPGAKGDANDNKSSKPMNTAQVVGIAVGGAAAAGLVMLLILILRIRRRKNGDHRRANRTGFFSSKRDSWHYKIEKGNDSSDMSWVAHQVPASVDPAAPAPPPPPPPPPPKAYNRTSWRPSAIGFAVSPSFQRDTPPPPKTPPSRRMSRLLPAKPILPLNIPPKKSSPLREPSPPAQRPATSTQNVQPRLRNASVPPKLPRLQIPSSIGGFLNTLPSQLRRDSSMTEFEEDGRGSLSPGGQIWRPPSATPMTTTAYYIADGYGNWVLGNSKQGAQLVELEAPTPMTSQPKSAESAIAVMPIVSPEAPSEPTQLKPAAQITALPLANIQPASALQASQAAPLDSGKKQEPVAPKPLFSSNPNPQRVSHPARSSSRGLTRPRITSADSDTTIITTSSQEDSSNGPTPPAVEEQVSLSPVFESPHSVTGRSPVAYPKIHERKNSNVANKATDAAPLPQRIISYHPPGQSNPTFGNTQMPPQAPVPMQIPLQMPLQTQLPSQEPTQTHAQPQARRNLRLSSAMSSGNMPRGPNRVMMRPPNMSHNPGARPPPNMRPPPKAVNLGPPIDPALLRSGSPTMRMVDPSPEPDDRTLLPSLRPRGPAMYGNNPQLHGMIYPGPYPGSQQQPMRQQRPQPATGWGLPAHPRPQQNQWQGPTQPRQQPVQNQPPLRQPRHSNSYHDYPPPQNPLQYHPQQYHPQQYQRPRTQTYPRPQFQPQPEHHSQQPPSRSFHGSNPSLLAKRLGSDRAATMSLSTDGQSSGTNSWQRDGLLSPGLRTPRQQTDLPSTPTWLPRLTPSRRGEDLYLNVQ